ncbi:hypothetical protein [Gloeothece verrucosa]|uniref:hypothetical protein n=1 Tax=Gloeothece verrucosa TaxID=2546359 RepID=UPI0012FECC3A|nr:hypothetical protein [Gloeothece verrucosa]
MYTTQLDNRIFNCYATEAETSERRLSRRLPTTLLFSPRYVPLPTSAEYIAT